jgi:hypothetical protein
VPSVPHVGGLALTNTRFAGTYRNNLVRISFVSRRSSFVNSSSQAGLANALGFVISHENGHVLGISQEFSQSPGLMRAGPSPSDARLDPREVRRARSAAGIIRNIVARFVRQ